MSDTPLITQPEIVRSASQDRRRKYILSKTRDLIAAHGIDGLKVRDLANECGVATATLYNQFGSLDGVIAAALESDFRQKFAPLFMETAGLSISEKLVRRMTVSAKEVIKLGDYTRALMFYYFHHTPRPDFRSAIHDYMSEDFKQIVNEIDARGDLHAWVVPGAFADDIVTQLYAIVMKWAQGYISNRQLKRRLMHNAFASFLGICKGQTHTELENTIENLS